MGQRYRGMDGNWYELPPPLPSEIDQEKPHKESTVSSPPKAHTDYDVALDDDPDVEEWEDRLERIEHTLEGLQGGGRVCQGISPIFLFGSCLAMVISWSENQSILWAILHGLVNWFYVVYYAWTHY